jgi:hypothetical protein
MATKIQLRRDTAADWTSTNPTLAAGEIGFESDTNKFKIGDGATAWTSLNYAPEGYATTSYVDTQDANIASDSLVFTNKTFDANGTGNSISNIETADIAAGTLVTAAEGIGSNDNDTTIPTSAAVKAYADSVGGGGASTGDITFTGSTIQSPSNADITLEPGGTGDVVMPAISFQDNLITTNRSNDSLAVGSNGTGQIILSTTDTFSTSEMTNNRFTYGGNSIDNMRGVNLLYREEDIPEITTDSDRRYIHGLMSEFKLATGINTADTNMRFRNYLGGTALDMNGSSSTNTSLGRGPRAADFQTAVLNSNATTATLGSAVSSGAAIFIQGANSTGDINVTNMASYRGVAEVQSDTGITVAVTNNYGFHSSSSMFGSGTHSITNDYGFYVNSLAGTNKYAFYDNTNSLSVFGDIQTQAVSITDNLITTNRSNDSLFIGTNGTGRIELSADGGQLASSTTYPKYFGNENRVLGVVLSRETSTDIDALTNREYGHVIHYGSTVTNGSTSNSNWNPRTCMFTSHTNMDGNSYTLANVFRGPTGLISAATANNGSGSSSSSLYTLRGSVVNAGISDYDSPTQDLTITDVKAMEASCAVETNGSSTNTITDAYNFYSKGVTYSDGTSTNTITNLYGFYHDSTAGTNTYAFYDASNSLSVFGDIQTQAVSITDNLITTNRSNDNLYIQANGTGRVNIGDVKLEDADLWSKVFGNASRIKGNALTYEDLAVNPNDLTDRELGHAIYMGTKITASSTNSNFRPRAAIIGSVVELDGFSYTNTNNFRGPLGAQIYGAVSNGTSTAVTCNTVRAIETSATVADFTLTSGAITVVDAIGNHCANYHDRNGTGDINITNDYGFKFAPEAYNASGGTGVTTITNSYAFHCQANDGTATITNAYAFYSTDATASSRMGAIRLDNQSGDPTHGADFSWIFAKDDASSSEVFVKDEAGNVTKISPHNAAGEWEYYSKNSKTGKTVRINMEKLVAEVEKLSGKTFIESE